MTTNIQAQTWVSDSYSNTITYFCIDFGSTVLLILLVFYTKAYIYALAEKQKIKQPRVNNYAIEVKGFVSEEIGNVTFEEDEGEEEKESEKD